MKWGTGGRKASARVYNTTTTGSPSGQIGENARVFRVEYIAVTAHVFCAQGFRQKKKKNNKYTQIYFLKTSQFFRNTYTRVCIHTYTYARTYTYALTHTYTYVRIYSTYVRLIYIYIYMSRLGMVSRFRTSHRLLRYLSCARSSTGSNVILFRPHCSRHTPSPNY